MKKMGAMDTTRDHDDGVGDEEGEANAEYYNIFVKINICPSLISIKNQFNSRNANEEVSGKRMKQQRTFMLF